MSDINDVRDRLEEVAAVCERDQWGRAALDIRALLADHARLQALIDGKGNQQTHVLPAGWRVIPHSSPWREGERWEVYGPSGGGSISTEEIQEPVVRDLLDVLAGIKPTKGEGE